MKTLLLLSLVILAGCTMTPRQKALFNYLNGARTQQGCVNGDCFHIKTYPDGMITVTD